MGKSASGILDTDYITNVFFNQEEIASTVEKTNVWVKKATVTYSFPNQFNIAVKEYPIVAYRQTTNGYVSILQSGKTGGTVSTSNLPDKFITLKMDDEKKIEELVKELNKLDTKIKNNIQIINLTPTKATSDLLTIELYDGNSIRVPLSQLTVKLPYYEKIKSQLSDGSIVDMEVGLYTTTPEVESSKTDGDKKKDKDKTDKKEENATSEEGQDTTTSMEQHSEEESNSENPGIQGQENPTVGQETTHRTSPAQG